MTIAVHRVTEADCTQLAAMHCQCFAEGWSSDSFFALLTSGQVFGFVGKGLDAPEWESFGIGRVAADEAEILTLGTLPSHRGQGLASKLLTAIMDEIFRSCRANERLSLSEKQHSRVNGQPAPTSPGQVVVGVMAYYGRADDPVRGAGVRRHYVGEMADFVTSRHQCVSPAGSAAGSCASSCRSSLISVTATAGTNFRNRRNSVENRPMVPMIRSP